jgi:hypothetical protein
VKKPLGRAAGAAQRVRSVGILSDPAFGFLLHGWEMQAPAWLPVIVQNTQFRKLVLILLLASGAVLLFH